MAQQHVVMFSGGIASWAAAKRVARRFGTAQLTLLFTDTLIEDADLYRFLDEGAANVGGHLVKIAEGRTPQQVFLDTRFQGNDRVKPCSRILKQEPARAFLEEHFEPATTTIYLGMDWTEGDRHDRAARNWAPWPVESPLLWEPMVSRHAIGELLAVEGIELPRLYQLGAGNNNCSGRCVRAGAAHWKWLYYTLPDVYADAERDEEEVRAALGKDVAILRYRSGPSEGQPRPLRVFRGELAAGDQMEMFPVDCGGCFTDDNT